ncbi:uncharacterized protein LOC109891583 isoform X3 [Oncorhynchus kisutch]|uniref:uncharacterized protein LOC109891583 isoform X3 n=1 Tax=Oncorhynchus kisutch TaxID=8019 RepID=UPI0012DE15C3|nr:uncharacterized protein LOC109891583 isoform X3 [Oncorhynchus kisutch]
MQNPDSGQGESTKNASGSVHSDNNATNSGEIKPPGFDAVSVLWTFGKCLGALLPVYLVGYYRVSASFLVFGLMVYTGWRHSREAKEARLRSAIHHYDNEKQYTSMKIFRSKKDLPAWVNFPDVEKVEWLNKILQQVWPFVGQYLEKLLVETIAPSIRSSSTHLQTLTFTKVDFGDKAMKVVGVKAHTENERGQVLLDVYISYVGNVEINVEVKRYFCKAGVKGIQLHGMMRVILEPLIGDVPIVGAVTMFFIRRPKLDINWTGLTNLLDIPGLNIMSDTMIMDAIASFLVLPNRLTVPLVADLHVAQLRSPLPRGVVRIHLLEADDLPAKDNYMKGVIAGLSDPYALCRVGPQTFTSHVVDNTVCPKWGEMYEVIVHEVPGQELEVEVYDKDPDNDDFLGRTKIDLGIVKKSKVVDEWFTLKETKSGRVHFRLEWLVLLPNTERLEQVLQRNESMTVSSKTSDPPSAAILAVYLDKAEALPMKKGNKEPSPMVQLSVQDITRESRTCWTTINPKWEDAFTFFIPDPHKQSIDIQVKDNDRIQTLGSLSIPLSRLLSGPNLSLDQWFQLDKSGPASRIYINTVLRVLWLDEENIPTSSTEAANLAAGLSKIRPQQTSPDPSFATEGVLRIHLLEGQNLVPKDNMMGGMVKGKSDPYVKINIGGETFESRVINRNLNPTWNEMYEVVLTTLPGQELHVELFDKDMDMKDDFMGRLKISLKDIITSQYTDQWYTLNDVKSGRLHLVLEWVPTVSQPDRLDQVFQFQSRQSYHNKAFPSMALLFVFVERADGLPLKKSGKEPKVGAELVVGGTSHKTTVCDRTISPQWDEAFYFLVHDPREEILIVKLSHSWTLPIGSLVVPVRELLSEPDLVLDQWLSLDGASPDSQILLRAELKVLCPKKCEIDVERADQPRARAASNAEQSLERDTVQQRCISVDTPSAPSPSPSSIPAPVPEPEEAKRVTVTEMVPEEVTEEPCLPGTLPTHTNPEPSFGSEGVLRIHLLEAQNLIAKDNLMGGLKKGKSDPYVKINIGGVKFKSHVIKENLNPTWNEMYETVMTPQSDQEVQVELYDKDMDKDDFLGRCNISMRDIIHSQYTDQWYTLNDVKSGRVHLVLEWVPTVSQPDRLDQVLQLQSLQSYQNKAVPSAALLFVYMDRAHSLPLKKSGKEPKAGAELVLGETTYRTKVCDRTNSPQWEEAFYFLVRDPREEILIVKLSSAWDQAMGSLVVPVRELLSEPDLVLDQWLSLDGASPDSQILLRAELKILNSKMTEGVGVPQGSVSGPEIIMSGSYSEEKEQMTIEQPVTATIGEKQHSEVPSEESVAVSSQPSISEPEEAEVVFEVPKEDPSPPETLPPHTTPDRSFDTEIEEPEETEEPITQLSVTADTEELQPWQGPTAGSVTEDIARATVSSLPSVSVPEEAEVMPDVIPETRPPHTTPHPSFGTEGVLRIHVLEAQDLVAMDKLMGGLKKGKSDPYVKINIGVVKFKSRVIKENLNPTWNEMFETVLNPQAGQEVQVELYDKDMDADDFLGRFMMRLSDVISSQYTDQWYTLNDVKSGRLHLVLEWVPTVSQPDRLNKVLQLQSLQSYQNKAVPSAALLFVYMDRAHSLPLKKSGKEPKAGAELVLGETTYRTKVCDRTNSPQWEEAFYFLVRDPREEILIVKLSSAWDQAMGSLVVPVRELLSEPDLVLDQWLSLDGASPDSQILLRAELKILNSKMTEGVGVPQGSVSGPEIIMSGSYSEEKEQMTIEQPVTATIGEKQHSEVPSEESVAVSSQPSISEPEEAEVVFEVPKEDPSPPETLPPHTTPDRSFDTEIEEPEETEEPITQLSVTADTEELQPWQGPTAGSVTEDIARATVSSLPSVSVPEEAEVMPDVIPETRPPHTTPHPSFGTEGVLRIHVLEAQDLVAMDKLMGGLKKGKSDPYVKINIGVVKFKSRVIKENLNPTWNEMFETMLNPQAGQEVQVELYDKDMDADDFLGRFMMRLSDVISSQYTDQWYTLNDVKSGRLHLVLEWVPTVSQPDRLNKVLQLQSLQSYQNKAVPSAALLFVYMDRAHSLPLKKSGKEPKAGAELVLGETTYRTKVCDRTNSPQWEEAFYFLVRDPREEILIVKLSSAWDQAMGSLVVPVRELLSEPDLVLDQWLSLDGASPDSQILLRAELKILNSKMTEGVGVPQGSVSGPEIILSGSYSEEKKQITIEQPVTATIGEKQHSEVPSEESVAVSSQPSISEPEEAEVVFEVPKEDPSPPETLPPHTSPDHSFDTEIEEPEETEEPITQLSVTADTEELQPWQGPTAGSVTEDIARATVSSLPSVSVPEEAEVMPDVIPETRPPHTTPHPSFGTEGVLRIHVLEAQDLVAMDKLMGGLKKGKSDPYVKINIGVVKFKSRVIKENLNPTWNEMFETVLNPQAGQEVQVELYDKDMDADDFLGRFMMRLSDVISSQYTDQWYTLTDVKSGRLHLVLEWVPTVSQPDRLDQVLQLQSLQSYQNKAVPSAALLFVYMDRAHSLPMKKSGKEPKAGAELVLVETTYRTKVCDRTNSPQWDEAFYFLVRDPKEEMLIVKLSSAWDQAMGSLVVPVRELLSQPDLVLDQWLSLDGASPDSQILLRAELKILESKMVDLIGHGILPCAAGNCGQVKLSLSYASKKKKLTIIVHACRDLESSSKDGLDTYVSLVLLPDKNKATKRKTSIKKRDLNPEYNERFEFELSVEEARRRHLSVSVKNSKASFRSSDLIGQVQIELAQIDLASGVTEWFDLKQEAE